MQWLILAIAYHPPSLRLLPLSWPNLKTFLTMANQGLKTASSLQYFQKQTLGRVDFLGATLILMATLLFVAALKEAGRKYPWKSAHVISLLSISGVLWMLFLAWERKVSQAAAVQEPVFPWRFMHNRTLIGMIL